MSSLFLTFVGFRPLRIVCVRVRVCGGGIPTCNTSVCIDIHCEREICRASVFVHSDEWHLLEAR